MSEKTTFRKNTVLLTAGSLVNKGLLFIAIPFFSRWLSTEEYGQFDIYYTYVSLLVPLISLSIHESIFRFSVDENDMNRKKAFISSGLIVYLFNLIIVGLILPFLIDKIHLSTIVCFYVYICTEAIGTYMRGYLRAIKKLDIYSFSMAINTVFVVIFVTIFVYLFRMGLNGILLGYGLGGVFGNILLLFWGKLYIYFSIRLLSISECKRMLIYSLPLIPNDISWWIMNASDRQIINIFFGDTANGVYAIAHKIPAFCSVIFNMFAISWQQQVVEKIGDEDNSKYINEIFNKLIVLLLSLCSGLMSCSFVIYMFIFDVKYFDAILYSPILIAAAVMMAISQFYGGIQIALKKPGQNGFTTVLGAITNVIMHVVLVNYIGLYAAAVSTLFANTLILILRIILTHNIFSIRLKRNSMLAIIFFVYFMISAYLYKHILFDIINLSLSVIIFCFINRQFMISIINSLYRKGRNIKYLF